MLDRLTLTDYRGFAKIDVELKPLTVLIGRNGSGKTTILNAIREQAPETIIRRYPENGLHPTRQASLLTYFRDLT